MWHITYQCGLQCKFCFAKKESGYLDITELKKYIARFKELAVQKVDISGGEPLLYLHLKELCNDLYQNGIFMTITTRGIGSEENLSWLISNRQKFARIIVSLDVPGVELMQGLSGGTDAFKKTVRFIGELKEKQFEKIRINTVVTQYLLDEEILRMMEKLIAEMRCLEWCLIEPHPANKKDTFEQVRVGKEDFEKIVSRVKKDFSKETACKVLVRYAENYAGYWVLYPEGILAKHTHSENDIMKMNFLTVPMEVVLQCIEDNKLWIPGAG